MKYYHVSADLESRFSNAKEAVEELQRGLYPRIPKAAGPDEDQETPRVCLAPTVEDCLSALKLVGLFRRCLAANEDAKSYETRGLEVYPIAILEFELEDNDIYVPMPEEVPDVLVTHEVWVLKHVVPTKVSIAWLHSRSIIWRETFNDYLWYACDKVEFAKSTLGRNHPWLNGRGTFLDSSELEPVYPDQIPRVFSSSVTKLNLDL